MSRTIAASTGTDTVRSEDEVKKNEHHHHHKLTPYRILGYVFSIIAALSLGFITMISFVMLFPGASWGWAAAAFVAGSLVEADVYMPGVTGGFKHLFFKWGVSDSIFKGVKSALVKQAIRKSFSLDQASIPPLLELINSIKTENTKLALSNFGFIESEIAKLQDLKATALVEALLMKILQKKAAFKAEVSVTDRDSFVQNEVKTLLGESVATKLWALSEQIQTPAFQSKFKRRYYLALVGLVFAAGTGIAFAAITFTHVMSAVLGFAGLGAMSAATPAWAFVFAGGLAFFAGTAYFMMMYHMLTKAITGNLLKQIKEKLYDAFVPREALLTREQKIRYALQCFFKALVLLSVVVLCVLVTMATADAWFSSSEKFFSLFSRSFDVIPRYATALSYTLVWAMFLPITAMFAIENSAVSLQDFWEDFKKIPALVRNFCKALRLRYQQENALQFFNIFRLIAALLEALLPKGILTAHVVASGVIPGAGVDEVGGFMDKAMPPMQSMVAGIVVEVTTDAHFIEEDKDEDEEDKNDLAKRPGAASAHDHHGGVTAFAVSFIIFIPKYLGFVWDNFFKANSQWWLRSSWNYKAYCQYLERRPDAYAPLPTDDKEVGGHAIPATGVSDWKQETAKVMLHETGEVNAVGYGGNNTSVPSPLIVGNP